MNSIDNMMHEGRMYGWRHEPDSQRFENHALDLTLGKERAILEYLVDLTGGIKPNHIPLSRDPMQIENHSVVLSYDGPVHGKYLF